MADLSSPEANKAAGPDPAKSSVFGAAFAKLKAKAEALETSWIAGKGSPRSHDCHVEMTCSE